MDIITRQAERFHHLFAGSARAHGRYTLPKEGTPDENGKQQGLARTESGPVTVQLWRDHLTGKTGIGIVPVREDSTCVFGAVDIDVYADLDHSVLARGLKAMALPLVVCRSKSGGAHLYLFTSAPVPAARIRQYLHNVRAHIGHAKAEVFPKQDYIADGDSGNWINACFQNGDNTTRYAFAPDGSVLGVEQFLEYAESMKVSPDLLSKPLHGGTDFADGPPCLQTMAVSGGCPSGARNKGLFNFGVYARKKVPDDFGSLMDEYNRQYMAPPLPSEEVVQIKKSVGRKTYNYTCREEPLVSRCQAQLCKQRTYGIGGDSTPLPQFGILKKLNSDPPSYVWTVDDQPLALSADEILSFREFSRAVFMRLNRLMPPMKADQWQEVIGGALQTMVTEEMPEDASPDGQLWEHVKAFCLGRVHALALEEVTLGKPFRSQDGFFYFRIADIVNHLGRHHFRAPPVQEIAASLRRRGGKHLPKKLRGQSVNLWVFPEKAIAPSGFGETQQPFGIPESISEDLGEF